MQLTLVIYRSTKILLFIWKISNLDLPSRPVLVCISRFIKANIPVITNLSNLQVSLPLSPVFFAIRLLFWVSPNFSHWKTWIELPVIRYRFWIWFLFTCDRKFRRWNHLQNGVDICTRRFIELVCPLYILGQWSNGSASQNFAFGSNFPVLR